MAFDPRLRIGQILKNADVVDIFKCGNMGGMRRSRTTNSLVIVSDYTKDPAVRRRYGRAWKRIRDSYVKTHPFCELCYEKGVIAPVEEVHHKVPLAEGGTHERSNLISLCSSCHRKLHAERGDRWNKTKEYKY